MRSVKDAAAKDPLSEADEDAQWINLGVYTHDVAMWKAKGFGPFEAALAQGDGFTPSIVALYHRQLRRVARTWVRQGLDSVEGLGWHPAGFAAADAVRWRSQGDDVAAARFQRGGYGRGSTRSGPYRHRRRAHR